MKKIFRFTTIAFVIFALLLSTFPASAGATKTEVTGKVWGVDFDGPEYKQWISDTYVSHWRGEQLRFQYVTDDPRLDGWAYLINNGEAHFTPDWTLLFIHVWGKWTIFAEAEGLTPLWECSSTGFFDAYFNYSAKALCTGVGVNKGLLAKFDLNVVAAEYDGSMNLNGEIIDTGQ